MPDKQPFYDLPLAYPLAGLPQANSVKDIVYLAEGDDAPRLDIYRPAGTAPPGGFPPVLLLHGGPLPGGGNRPSPKEWRVFQDYGRLLAGHGLAAVLPSHRYLGYEGLPQAITDALAARSFLAEQGEAYGLDGSLFLLWAFSGAGMLLTPFLRGDVPGLQGLIAFYPMLDLTHVPQATERFGEDVLIALSPLSIIDRIPPDLPIFLARAGLDRPGLNRALDTFVKEALYHNKALLLENVPQANHGFDMFDKTAIAGPTIARAAAFAKKTLNSDEEIA